MTITKEDVGQVVGVEVKKLDFSIWHPLDHQIWDAICSTYYGGRQHHLSLWWDYGSRPHPIQSFKCAVGWHDWTPYWRGPRFGDDVEPAGEMCRGCMLHRN